MRLRILKINERVLDRSEINKGQKIRKNLVRVLSRTEHELFIAIIVAINLLWQ